MTQSKDDDQDLDEIKTLLNQEPTPGYDPDQSLKRVLSHAKQHTATRDIATFFISWIWMLFVGFGASMHQARHRRHPAKRRSSPRKQSTNHSKSTPE